VKSICNFDFREWDYNPQGEEIEIIGNIHETPGLLEAKE